MGKIKVKGRRGKKSGKYKCGRGGGNEERTEKMGERVKKGNGKICKE